MAETFGIVAGVLQVAGFGAEVGSNLWKCANKIRNANSELEALAIQVQDTSRCLNGVGTLLDDSGTKALHNSKLYEDTCAVSQGCRKVFHALQKAVQDFEDKSGKTVYKLPMAARFQWTMENDRLAELQKVLEHYRDVLHLMISVLHIVEGRRAATKGDLQALEAKLQHLTVSNKSLSHANQSLANTITALTQNHVSPNQTLSPKGIGMIPFIKSTQDDETAVLQLATSTLATLPASRGVPVPEVRKASDPMGDHLQRCMNSVLELAKTIACAMDMWQGKEKTRSSDVRGHFAIVTAELGTFPDSLECIHCARRVLWSDFEPATPSPEHAHPSACLCASTTHPAVWRPYDGSKSDTTSAAVSLNGTTHTPEALNETKTETSRPGDLNDPTAEPDRSNPQQPSKSLGTLVQDNAAGHEALMSSPYGFSHPQALIPPTSYHHSPTVSMFNRPMPSRVTQSSDNRKELDTQRSDQTSGHGLSIQKPLHHDQAMVDGSPDAKMIQVAPSATISLHPDTASHSTEERMTTWPELVPDRLKSPPNKRRRSSKFTSGSQSDVSAETGAVSASNRTANKRVRYDSPSTHVGPNIDNDDDEYGNTFAVQAVLGRWLTSHACEALLENG